MKEKETRPEKNSCCRAGRRECPTERQCPGLEDAARLFRALGDETRLAILKQLRAQGEVCACDFLACCEVAQPTVSHHLKVLREVGLVDTEKRGLWVFYTLNRRLLDSLKALLP
jgi:ArsR family transcriptional regulator, arsenate/arsenite/antimonite-responsive transcriptional repressor